MTAFARYGLIGVLSLAGMSGAAASELKNDFQPAVSLTELSLSQEDAAEFQQVHRRSYRHRHRGYRSNSSHRFRSHHFRRYGYSNYYRSPRYGYRYGRHYPRYYYRY